MRWRARNFEFSFPRPALVMGVVNVTPDSFSDGGRYFDTEAAVAHGLEMVAQGADLLDVGGESTRPGAAAVSEAEEMRRVIPVIERLAGLTRVPLSVDTLKLEVARAGLAAGASVVNDVGAVRRDPGLGRLLSTTGAGYVAMHMQGTPATMQENPWYEDVVESVGKFFGEVKEGLMAEGVAEEQLVLDVGIGFGKTMEHNLELLANMEAFRDHGRPLLVGVSRKSFIGRLTGAPVEARLPGSLASACLAVTGGVEVVRTHDVAETVQALRILEAIRERRRA